MLGRGITELVVTRGSGRGRLVGAELVVEATHVGEDRVDRVQPADGVGHLMRCLVLDGRDLGQVASVPVHFLVVA